MLLHSLRSREVSGRLSNTLRTRDRDTRAAMAARRSHSGRGRGRGGRASGSARSGQVTPSSSQVSGPGAGGLRGGSATRHPQAARPAAPVAAPGSIPSSGPPYKAATTPLPRLVYPKATKALSLPKMFLKYPHMADTVILGFTRDGYHMIGYKCVLDFESGSGSYSYRLEFYRLRFGGGTRIVRTLGAPLFLGQTIDEPLRLDIFEHEDLFVVYGESSKGGSVLHLDVFPNTLRNAESSPMNNLYSVFQLQTTSRQGFVNFSAQHRAAVINTGTTVLVIKFEVGSTPQRPLPSASGGDGEAFEGRGAGAGYAARWPSGGGSTSMSELWRRQQPSHANRCRDTESAESGGETSGQGNSRERPSATGWSTPSSTATTTTALPAVATTAQSTATATTTAAATVTATATPSPSPTSPSLPALPPTTTTSTATPPGATAGTTTALSSRDRSANVAARILSRASSASASVTHISPTVSPKRRRQRRRSLPPTVGDGLASSSRSPPSKLDVSEAVAFLALPANSAGSDVSATSRSSPTTGIVPSPSAPLTPSAASFSSCGCDTGGGDTDMTTTAATTPTTSTTTTTSTSTSTKTSTAAASTSTAARSSLTVTTTARSSAARCTMCNVVVGNTKTTARPPHTQNTLLCSEHVQDWLIASGADESNSGGGGDGDEQQQAADVDMDGECDDAARGLNSPRSAARLLSPGFCEATPLRSFRTLWWSAGPHLTATLALDTLGEQATLFALPGDEDLPRLATALRVGGVVEFDAERFIEGILAGSPKVLQPVAALDYDAQVVGIVGDGILLSIFVNALSLSQSRSFVVSTSLVVSIVTGAAQAVETKLAGKLNNNAPAGSLSKINDRRTSAMAREWRSAMDKPTVYSNRRAIETGNSVACLWHPFWPLVLHDPYSSARTKSQRRRRGY